MEDTNRAHGLQLGERFTLSDILMGLAQEAVVKACAERERQVDSGQTRAFRSESEATSRDGHAFRIIVEIQPPS